MAAPRFTNPLVRWIDRRLPIFTFLHHEYNEFPMPKNLNYLWSFGALATVALVVALLGLSAPATRPRVAYLVGVVASIGLYSAVFVLSLWEPVTNHILSSLNRLLLAPALVALLMTVVLGEWRVAGRATGVDLPELNRRHASRERAGDGEREPHVPAAEPPAPTPAPAPTPTPTPRLTPAGRVSSPRRARASEGGSITA